MQFAKASKDLLILAPSLSLMPLFSVTVPLSEPARSIKESFPLEVSTSVFFVFGLEFKTI
jgi:hypothetical protein